jgi:hypothetical protein
MARPPKSIFPRYHVWIDLLFILNCAIIVDGAMIYESLNGGRST